MSLISSDNGRIPRRGHHGFLCFEQRGVVATLFRQEERRSRERWIETSNDERVSDQRSLILRVLDIGVGVGSVLPEGLLFNQTTSLIILRCCFACTFRQRMCATVWKTLGATNLLVFMYLHVLSQPWLCEKRNEFFRTTRRDAPG